jgi:hypothetical protein
MDRDLFYYKHVKREKNEKGYLAALKIALVFVRLLTRPVVQPGYFTSLASSWARHKG